MDSNLQMEQQGLEGEQYQGQENINFESQESPQNNINLPIEQTNQMQLQQEDDPQSSTSRQQYILKQMQNTKNNLENQNNNHYNNNTQVQQQQIEQQQQINNNNYFSQTPQQSNYKNNTSHKNQKQLSQSQTQFDFLGSHFSYNSNFKEPPTISQYTLVPNKKQRLNMGSRGTTQINFRKERQRINADSLFSRFQQWFPSYQQNTNKPLYNNNNDASPKNNSINELEKGISFRLSREKVKFGQIPIKNTPGVGNYDVKVLKTNNYHFSFGKRTPNPIYNKNIIKQPGPGHYPIVGGINSEGTYNVDKFKNSQAQAFAPPDNNRFHKVKSKPNLGPGTYQYEKLNPQGQYSEAKLKRATGGQWAKTDRFEKMKPRVNTPGPGAYRIYKAVQNEPEKVLQKIQKQTQQHQKKYQNKPINLNSSSALLNNSNSRLVQTSQNSRYIQQTQQQQQQEDLYHSNEFQKIQQNSNTNNFSDFQQL